MSNAALAKPHSEAEPNGEAQGRLWKNAAGYAGAVLLSLLAVVYVLKLWRADLRVPLFDGGDNLMGQMFVQNVIETGWFSTTDRLGASGGQDLRDYPMADFLHFSVLWMLSWFSNDTFVVFHLFILLPFVLIPLFSYFVLRQLGLNRALAVAASVLYTCLPFHFVRMGPHLFLGSYYLVPLMVLLLVRVYQGRDPLREQSPTEEQGRLRLFSWRAGGALLVAVLTGLAGVYYAFFSCFFLCVTGIRNAFQVNRITALIGPVLLIVCITGGVAFSLAPSFLHRMKVGVNKEAAHRHPFESEIYGLKVNEMFLPINGHRIQAFCDLREKFLHIGRPRTHSLEVVPLGIVASLGFILLVGQLLWSNRFRQGDVQNGLAYLNILAVILASVGGLGACFSFLVSPLIRCYDRISIFIAFFALAALFLALQRIGGTWATRGWAQVLCLGALGGLVVAGVYDQTSRNNVPRYAENRADFNSWQDFGKRLETTLPAGSMVCQLPYMTFPDSGVLHQLHPYDLLKPYLHTRTLRFSYGAMMGRETSNWHGAVAALPTAQMVEKLALGGFRGIYIDRAGYVDGAAKLEAELTQILGVAPTVSLGGRQSFFDMGKYVQGYREQLGDEEWEVKSQEAMKH